jgi:fumarate hydratase subunit alpha
MMRTINAAQITDAVAKLCISTNIHADPAIRCAVRTGLKAETEPLPRTVLNMILENMDIAASENMPICQDTGMAVVFVDIGQEVYVDGNLAEAINQGVRQGYKEGYLRASVVGDPLERENTGDNTPAVIHYNIVEGSSLKITVMPKGLGRENKGMVKMLTPSAGRDGVVDFVVEAVRTAGADPRPPIVVGVGMGGTMEKAALLSKQALLSATESSRTELEQEIFDKINALNIGPAGLGGRTTALGVRVLSYPTHIAGLPVAVNIGCHVSRHGAVVV